MVPDAVGDAKAKADRFAVDYAKVVAKAAVTKALAEVNAAGLQPATVLGPPLSDATGTMYGTVVVQLDADLPESRPVEVAVLTESSPVAGQRCMVQTVAPWGLFLSHFIGGRNPGVARLEFSEGEAWQEFTLDDSVQTILLDCPTLEAGGLLADAAGHAIVVDRPGVYRYDLKADLGQRNLAGLPMGAGIRVDMFDADDIWHGVVDTAGFSFTSTDPSSPEWVTLNCHGLCSMPAAGYRIRGVVYTPATTGEMWTDGSAHLDLQWVANYVPEQTCGGGGG